MTTMANLPLPIMWEIFLRLPVKSLLCSKCVCKEWFQIISSRQFATLHLRHPQTQARTRLCIIEYKNDKKPNRVGRVSVTKCDDNGTLLGYDCLTSDIEQKKMNLICQHAYFVDSCDGLFCVIDSSVGIFLWNPSTRQIGKVPPNPNISIHNFLDFLHLSKSYSPPCYGFGYGFGYDCFSDDYKIVQAFISKDDEDGIWKNKRKNKIKIDVFSLKSYSWTRRILNEKPHARIACKKGVVFHGAVHWVATSSIDGDDYLILVFDFQKEEFREMKFPIRNIYCARLKVVQGYLCVYDKLKDPIKKWVMKDYGVEASWTEIASPHAYASNCQLLDFLNNLHLLINEENNEKKLVLWDHKENTEHDVMDYEDWKWGQCHTNLFMESLVSPYPSLKVIRKTPTFLWTLLFNRTHRLIK